MPFYCPFKVIKAACLFPDKLLVHAILLLRERNRTRYSTHRAFYLVHQPVPAFADALSGVTKEIRDTAAPGLHCASCAAAPVLYGFADTGPERNRTVFCFCYGFGRFFRQFDLTFLLHAVQRLLHIVDVQYGGHCAAQEAFKLRNDADFQFFIHRCVDGLADPAANLLTEIGAQ